MNRLGGEGGGREHKRDASFYESHRAAASLSAELEIDFAEFASKTDSQGWALCQGCHLAARTTLLSVLFQNTDHLGSLIFPAR